MVLCVVSVSLIRDFPIAGVQHRTYAIAQVVVVVSNANRAATASSGNLYPLELRIGHRDGKLGARCEQETRCYCLSQTSFECKRSFERTRTEDLVQRYTG